MTTPEAIQLAQQMRSLDWPITYIQRHLAEHGIVRSWPTVKRWADPQYRLRDNERRCVQLRADWAARTAGRLGRRGETREYQEARARGLSAHGLSQINVARAMDFDYPGEGWTYRRVQALLGPARETKTTTQPVRKVLR